MHGTCVWDNGFTGRKDSIRKEAAIRKAYEDFSYKTAEWMPYFKAEDGYCRIANEEVKASLYYHPGQDMLLIIGNYGKQEVKAEVHLELAALGLQGKELTARNALTDQELPIAASGLLTVAVKAKSFVLAVVRVKE